MRRTHLTKGRISQLFDEDQPFGELAARNLAERLHLPHDFFERDPAGRSAVPAETAGAFMAKPVTAEQRALLDDMEELLPEDYDRIRRQIAELAGRMRKHSEYVLKRAGVASPTHPTAPSAKRLPEPSPTGNVRKPAHAKRRAS